ncbi:plectin-like [Diadema setosum]|uniref:plectin-like n=1 Tax=Diadema setosum TaxID=31175 RepID=UPI003B3A084E
MAVYGNDREFIPILQVMSGDKNTKWKSSATDITDLVDRTVLKIADERDRIQKKTFTKWVNKHLKKAKKQIKDLFVDLKDGNNLITLLELLGREKISREKGPLRIHKLQNVENALAFLRKRKVKLVNIRNEDIVDGNPKLILGLIWTIILHFQISEVVVESDGGRGGQTLQAKEALKVWAQRTTKDYPGVHITDFGKSWRDGLAFNAIINRNRPDLVDFSSLKPSQHRANLESAFSIAEKHLGVTRLLDPEDVDVPKPDEKSIMTYVSSLYNVFPRVPESSTSYSTSEPRVESRPSSVASSSSSRVEAPITAELKTKVESAPIVFPTNGQAPGLGPGQVESPVTVEIKQLKKPTDDFAVEVHTIKAGPAPPKPKRGINAPSFDSYTIDQMVRSMPTASLEEPVVQSGATSDRDGEWEIYKMAAQRHLDWVKHATLLMKDRNFPRDAAGMENLRRDFQRFQTEEVPVKLQEKNRLLADFRALERSMKVTGQFRSPAGLHANDIEAAWSDLMLAQQQRDKMLRTEPQRSYKQDSLDSLAEHVTKQITQVSTDLDTIETRIHEADGRADKMSASDVRMLIDDIESAAKTCENNIRILEREIQQLKDGQHYQASSLARKAEQLQNKLLAVRNYQIAGKTQSVTTKTMVQGEQIRVERRVQLHTERRIVDPKIYGFLDECSTWIQTKSVSIRTAHCGQDLNSVQTALAQSKADLQVIKEFGVNIERCRAVQKNLSGEDLQKYTEQMNKLDESYRQLLDQAANRVSDMEILLDFVQAATKELMWLDEKEEIEESRDWSSKNMDIRELEKYYKSLTKEVEARKRQFTSVQQRGEKLVMDRHPATETVSAYLSTMQSQWNWLQQLLVSLETHLKYAAEYHQFFRDTRDCDHWMARQAETLHARYDRTDLKTEEVDALLQELVELETRLSEYRVVVRDLVGRSQRIAPLKKRRQKIHSNIPVTAVCDYAGLDIQIKKGERCTLTDNSHRMKWKVVNSLGLEGVAPHVCFLIPPPNSEAIDLANKLEEQLNRLLALCRSKQTRLRTWKSQKQITQGIETVRQWTLEQFEDMEPATRQATIQQLNQSRQQLEAAQREAAQAQPRPGPQSQTQPDGPAGACPGSTPAQTPSRAPSQAPVTVPAQARVQLRVQIQPGVEGQAGVRGQADDVVVRQEVSEEFLSQDLIREVESCNQLIEELSAQSQQGKVDDPESRQLLADLDRMILKLEREDSRMTARDRDPLPRTETQADITFQEFKKSHALLTNDQPHYNSLIVGCDRALAGRGEDELPEVRARRARLEEAWDKAVAHSYNSTQRMSLLTDLLPAMAHAEEFISSCENILRNHEPMSCDLDRHQAVSDQLQELQRTLPPFQPDMDKLVATERHVRDTMQGSRTRDAERLGQKVQGLVNRWAEVCSQSHQRLEKLDQSGDTLHQLTDLLTSESNWITAAEVTLMEFEHVARDKLTLQQQFIAAREFNQEVAMHEPRIMAVNEAGEKFITQAESYDSALQLFRVKMDGLHGPTSAGKRPKLERGSEVARQELDALNRRYRDLVATVTERVDNISAVGKEENADLDKEYRNIFQAVSDLCYWTNITQQKLTNMEPVSKDIPTLTFQLEKHKNFLEEIVHQKEPISDALSKADRFIYNNKDQYLKPEQQKELNTKMGDLRRGYDQIVQMAEARLRELQSSLGHRRKEKDEMTALEKRYREEQNNLQGLLRWLSETEHAMGSAQPQSEQVQPLNEQLNKMKVRIDKKNQEMCKETVFQDKTEMRERELIIIIHNIYTELSA